MYKKKGLIFFLLVSLSESSLCFPVDLLKRTFKHTHTCIHFVHTCRILGGEWIIYAIICIFHAILCCFIWVNMNLLYSFSFLVCISVQLGKYGIFLICKYYSMINFERKDKVPFWKASNTDFISNITGCTIFIKSQNITFFYWWQTILKILTYPCQWKKARISMI